MVEREERAASRREPFAVDVGQEALALPGAGFEGAAGGAQSPTDSFFADLATRRHDPLLKSASGSVQFDLVDGERLEHWCVTIDRGDVAVSHKNAKADAVVRLDKATFDGMASGRVNVMAATLRGELIPEGDLGLVALFQRLFPGPPASPDVARAGYARRMR